MERAHGSLAHNTGEMYQLSGLRAGVLLRARRGVQSGACAAVGHVLGSRSAFGPGHVPAMRRGGMSGSLSGAGDQRGRANRSAPGKPHQVHSVPDVYERVSFREHLVRRPGAEDCEVRSVRRRPAVREGVPVGSYHQRTSVNVSRRKQAASKLKAIMSRGIWP
jgi:hypothetical protein